MKLALLLCSVLVAFPTIAQAAMLRTNCASLNSSQSEAVELNYTGNGFWGVSSFGTTYISATTNQVSLRINPATWRVELFVNGSSIGAMIDTPAEAIYPTGCSPTDAGSSLWAARMIGDIPSYNWSQNQFGGLNVSTTVIRVQLYGMTFEELLNLQLMVDPAWLGVGASQAGGPVDTEIDQDDWNYFFDLESGLFNTWFNTNDGLMMDLYEGWEYWFGGADDQPGGFFGNFQLIHVNAGTMIARLTSIAAALDEGTIGTFDDLDVAAGVDYDALQGVIDPTERDGSELLDGYASLIPDGADAALPPDMTFDLPLSQWFAGVFPGVSDISVTVETAPFEGVRNVLHAFFFAGVSLWSVLSVLGETRRQ